MNSKWKGQRRTFAEALVAAKPERKTNTELAVIAGCAPATAASAGWRLARDPLVRAYVRRHWPDYYGDSPTPAEDAEETAAPVLDTAAVKTWLQQMENDSPEFAELVQAVCRKLGASRNPVDYWDSVLINPHAPARDKARYTIARPASQSPKDALLEKMANRPRDTAPHTPSLFDEADQPYKTKLPQWIN